MIVFERKCNENFEENGDTHRFLMSFRSGYVNACQEYSSSLPDWNEAFQLTWELEDSTEALAQRRYADLRRIETKFKEEVSLAVKRLVDADFCLPVSEYFFLSKDCHGLQFKEGNVFYQVLHDVSMGKRYLDSLRGVLLSRVDDISVPLCALLVYRGLPFLVQALAPLRFLVHDGQDVVNEDVAENIRIISATINVPLPEYIQFCVYEGRDSRRYVVSTNSTTIPLVVTDLEAPLQRSEMLLSPFLRLVHPVATTMSNTFSCLKAPEFVYSVRSIGRIVTLSSSTEITKVLHQEQQNRLCAVLHYFGINLALLPLLLGTCRPSENCRKEIVEVWDDVKRVIGVELISRTIKNSFYSLSSADRNVGGNKAQRNLSRSIQWGLKDATPDSHSSSDFASCTHLIFRKYCTDPFLLKEILEMLQYCRKHCIGTIVSRVCILVGAKKERNDSLHVLWVPIHKAQLVPRISCPEVQRFWASAGKKQQEPISTTGSKENHTFLTCYNKLHNLAFWNPLRARVLLWKNNITKCLEIQRESFLSVNEVLKEIKTVSQKKFQKEFLSWPSTSYLYLRFLFSHIHSLFLSNFPPNVIEGCNLIPFLLDEAEKSKVNRLTLAKYHVRCGCQLLGLKHFISGANIEAAKHFVMAESILSFFVDDAFVGRLYIQACFGILHCDIDFSDESSRISEVTATSNLLDNLSHRALALATSIEPSEQFVEYFWTLALEIGNAKIKMFHEGVQLLTKALQMIKRIPRCRIAQEVILKDLMQMYCSWNEKKYKQYCSQLSSQMKCLPAE